MVDDLESKELEQKEGDLSLKPLPCPFCKIPAEILFDAVEGDTYGLFLIHHREDKCGLHKFGFYRYKTKAEAINHWNTRADNGLANLVNTLTDENSKLRYAGYEAAKQLTATQQALDSAVEALVYIQEYIEGMTGLKPQGLAAISPDNPKGLSDYCDLGAEDLVKIHVAIQTALGTALANIKG